MGIYPKTPYSIGADSSVLQCGRLSDKIVAVKPALPGNVIVIHGVNDVGVGFDQVEAGLCAGLGDRLAWGGQFRSASYRMPTKDDMGRLEIDPDAVFFKRHLQAGHHTPVIPFYWGYREMNENALAGSKTKHGQAVDRYGNRLDKDFSKGGGPFSNATTTLVDMWNRGFGTPGDVADWKVKDPLRPVLKAPGRMYMVLAAKRLAALIAMIRDYDDDEAVSIVAHSQGCMLSLLTQAFLMQEGKRPADTLVLTHPPYSLVDDIPLLNDTVAMFSGGEDAAMADRYQHIAGMQTLNARLRTLANIVQGVAAGRHARPAIESLKDPKFNGMVACEWQPAKDRDNRGKVYLYFTPEDMTVALKNVQGLGWQGVPDWIAGARLTRIGKTLTPKIEMREALKELGPGFFQRVFTARLRQQPGSKQPTAFLVGGTPPCDFPLLIEGENDHGHVAEGSVPLRMSPPEVAWPPEDKWFGVLSKADSLKREGIRTINGEKLNTPVQADMYAGGIDLKGQPQGANEAVDPIDAAISITSDYGLLTLPTEVIADPRPTKQRLMQRPHDPLFPQEIVQIANALNQGKQPADSFTIAKAHFIDGKQVRINRRETPNEARLRQQHSTAPRSFHSSIFGSAKNHRQVTAYDIAIGGGQASSDPKFYAYLCAVADWRLKKPDSRDPPRPGILTWKTFTEEFRDYLAVESKHRKARGQLIEASCDYYSTGVLPASLPVLPDELPPTLLSETMSGRRIPAPTPETAVKKPASAHLTTGERLAQNPAPDDMPPGGGA